MRGGGGKPNYDSVNIAQCELALEKAGLVQNIMVDCSHENSSKDAAIQPLVMENVTNQILEGNKSIIGLMIDVCINFVPTPENYINQVLLAIAAVLIVGLGGGIYLVANLGAGPRDGLMVGLQKKTNLPIALVRGAIEITVMSVGWYLGGIVGLGTLLFAFGIGPAVALGLYLVGKIFSN